MEIKMIIGLLIQCGILFQAVQSLSETNSTASWDHHIRKKRIIDTTPNKSESFLNQDVRYVILILNESGGVLCTGSILAPRIIISAAHCVVQNACSVESGGRRATFTKTHQILIKHVYENYSEKLKKNDLALLVLKEPIDLVHSHHRAIGLYEGTLPPNSHGLVTGWGSLIKGYPHHFPLQAQSIQVEIVSLQQCQHAYSIDPEITVTSKEICTYSFNRTRCCWFGDSGAPLVVGGHLVGIFSWFQANGESGYPDVFMNLLHPDYKWWVQSWVKHFLGHYPN